MARGTPTFSCFTAMCMNRLWVDLDSLPQIVQVFRLTKSLKPSLISLMDMSHEIKVQERGKEQSKEQGAKTY